MDLNDQNEQKISYASGSFLCSIGAGWIEPRRILCRSPEALLIRILRL